MSTVAVIGAGSWGSALAHVLATNGHQVRMYARNPEVAEELMTQHTNQAYLPGASFPETIHCSTSIEQTVRDVEVVLLVVPSHAMRATIRSIRPHLNGTELVVHASKGFELESGKRMSEVIQEELHESTCPVGVLSGPSHAEEVVQMLPTTITAASADSVTRRRLQTIFSNEYFRVYTNDDLIGVELGGSLKNIIALGAGISDGLGYGSNAKAALITRGLKEIERFAELHGAKKETLYGLSGIGDLIVTCASEHSRNWRAGYAIGQGESLDEVMSHAMMAVEGVKATRSVHQTATDEEIDMPITSAIYHILFEGQSPRDAVSALFDRDHKHESN